VYKLVLIALAAASLAGCAKIAAPPNVWMSEVEPSGRPALPPDCKMTVLRSRPLAAYREVAIIEGLGNVFLSESDVLPAVIAKSCETGADAIVINTSVSQTSEDMTGYYINAIAIIYKKEPGSAQTSQ
jgi:hypothetical protein